MEDDLNNSTAIDDSATGEENQTVESAAPAEEVAQEPEQETPQATEPVPPAVVEEPTQAIPQSSGQDKKSLMAGLLQKFKEKMFARKQARLQKIMDLANKKRKITVSDVRELLFISRQTATRYLSQLVKQDKLIRKGATKDEVYQIN